MKQKILKLREEGKSYKQIGEIIGLSKSTISYYIGTRSNNPRNKREKRKCMEWKEWKEWKQKTKLPEIRKPI